MTSSVAELTLAIGNVFEFNHRHLHKYGGQEIKQKRIEKDNFAVSAELALFWGSTNESIVIIPILPSPDRIAQLSEKLRRRISCFAPSLSTGFVCWDLLNDWKSLESIVASINGRSVELIPWGATEDFYALVRKLISLGVKIVSVEATEEESSWCVDYFDSKVGARSVFHNIARTNDDFLVPPGYICGTREEAACLAHASFLSHRAVVLKSSIGGGGAGVKIIAASASRHGVTLQDFLDEMRGDLWESVPIIVERRVGDSNLYTPTYDGIVHSTGIIEPMGIGNMIIEQGRTYVGVEMGLGVGSSELNVLMASVGEQVGEILASFGYRGWYDVDYLVANNTLPVYGSEINARRTGPTSAIEVASRLYGKNWNNECYVRTFERLHILKMLDYADIAEVVEIINVKSGFYGALLVPLFTLSLTLSSPYFGYLIVSSSPEHAIAIETELHYRLRNMGIIE